MARRLCPDVARATIGVLAAAAILFAGRPWVQVAVVAGGGVAGLAWCRRVEPPADTAGLQLRYGAKLGWTFIAAFVVLLLVLPLAARSSALLAVSAAFYRAGALVFGGGHVVLPLLEQALVEPGWISVDEFLAGYGAAQAVPGPLFSLAAYLGARLPGANGGLVGAAVALLSIFLPGFLLIAGVLPLWKSIARRPGAASAIAGVNAAVVGLLAAALYDPVWTSAVLAPVDVAIALVGFALFVTGRVPAILIVVWCVAASVGVATQP